MDSSASKIIKAQIKFILLGSLAIIILIFGFLALVATMVFAPIIKWLNNKTNNNIQEQTKEQEPTKNKDFIDVDFEVIDNKKNRGL